MERTFCSSETEIHSKSEEKIEGFIVAHDRLNLLFCSNSSRDQYLSFGGKSFDPPLEEERHRPSFRKQMTRLLSLDGNKLARDLLHNSSLNGSTQETPFTAGAMRSR
ncbi:hypothetical protein CDAR_489741 [Caerostris darwini]|uniref:Uncharacterized protein n=1 Tax=Caerostris darwini TaxID=1538125 RepID=A0AAV4VJL0_9ARAC|nr:hypothetical protein CDAR_489741 [Caerostris darwini]